MTTRSEASADPKGALFQLLEEERTGMLGIDGSGQLMQPMTHFTQEGHESLWFVTSLSSDLVRAVGLGAQAEYVLMSPGRHVQVSMVGPVAQSSDRAVLERIWSPAIVAWFEGGIDDPDVALLHMTLREGAMWVSDDSALRFGAEMLRSQVQPGHKPDIGDHHLLRFNV